MSAKKNTKAPKLTPDDDSHLDAGEFDAEFKTGSPPAPEAALPPANPAGGPQMLIEKTPRGFEIIYWPDINELPSRLVQQSSATDGNEGPGESFLWVGPHHLHNRDVEKLRDHLTAWLETGSFAILPKS